jgi:hypothetical protein
MATPRRPRLESDRAQPHRHDRTRALVSPGQHQIRGDAKFSGKLRDRGPLRALRPEPRLLGLFANALMSPMRRLAKDAVGRKLDESVG